MDNITYTPQPLDTSKITVTEDLQRLADLLAENAHAVWARERLAGGWRHGTARDDERKEHPGLVPFKDLPEEQRRMGRSAALETAKALLALGYRKETAADATPSNGAEMNGAEMGKKGARLLARLKNPKVTLPELRRLWEERLPLLWLQDAQTYRRATDAALRLGEAFLAHDIAAEGLKHFPGELRLTQLQALALARSGATRRANAILDELRKAGHMDEETLGLLARTHKDFWQLASDPEEKRRHLRLSYTLYAEAYQCTGGYYSGINAATTGLLHGDREGAAKIAREVSEVCLASLEFVSPISEERYWLEATLAEGALVLSDLPMAEDHYERCREQPGVSLTVLSRTRAQARLLLENLGQDPRLLDPCFNLPRIAVFSGHMFDRPGRRTPRLPQSIEPEIRAEIGRHLAAADISSGYCSLACGADLLFAEALLERGGELNVVLPFAIEEFKRTSVEIFPGDDSGARFDRALARAATVTILNDKGDPDDVAAYEFCNQVLSGLALLKCRSLGMDAVPIAVWDGKAGGGRGGTQSFVEYWQELRKTPVEVITPQAFFPLDLATIPAPAGPAPDTGPQRTRQEIKAMLFADIVGFTKLGEVQIPIFVDQFMGRVAKLMKELIWPPSQTNTWGDALYCVFDRVEDAGRFALDLRDMIRGTDWTEHGLPAGLNIRIALHAGPVFPCFDPVLQRRTFNGAHVNRTARIEPITEEGQIYTSEAFAVMAAATGSGEFVCDYVGTRQLAKKYGAIPVFLLRRGG